MCLQSARSSQPSVSLPSGTSAVLSTLRITSPSAPIGKKKTHANAATNAQQYAARSASPYTPRIHLTTLTASMAGS